MWILKRLIGNLPVVANVTINKWDGVSQTGVIELTNDGAGMVFNNVINCRKDR
jgi:hypothetical protein